MCFKGNLNIGETCCIIVLLYSIIFLYFPSIVIFNLNNTYESVKISGFEQDHSLLFGPEN
jgi:hypothetical protein